MAVVLVGVGTVWEMDDLAEEVSDRGSDPIRRSVTDWPGAPLAAAPGDDEFVLGAGLDYDDVEGAYVHAPALFRPKGVGYLDGFEVDDEIEPALDKLRDHRRVFESLCRIFESRGIDVLPRLHNHHLEQRMLWQLDRFERAGIPVPDTVFTNDPDEARAFCDRHERAIYKPVSEGAPPSEVTDADLADDRLENLRTAPVQFQEFVPGEDLRVYVLDGEVVGAVRYDSDRFSFKLDVMAGETVHAEGATVSAGIEESAVRAAEVMDLTFGAADVRRRPDGGHALLELNQAPAFAAADSEAGQRVTDAVAGYLTDG